MDKMLYVAMTGASQNTLAQRAHANNLANVSTNGFKRASAVFEDLMYQNLRQVGANSSEQSQLPTGLQLGLGVRTVATNMHRHAPSALLLRGNGGETMNGPAAGPAWAGSTARCWRCTWTRCTLPPWPSSSAATRCWT